jgi:hypothetical protein
MQLVLREINGFATEEIADKDGKVVYKKGQPLNTFAHMTDDGKTAGGCWIYTGVIVEGPDGKLLNKANGRKPADEKDPLGHGWAFAWPANRRILYNRAAADLAGQAVERAEEAHLVGSERPRRRARQEGQVGRARRARFQRDARARRQERRQAVHHADRPRGRLLRSPRRRAVPRAL